MVLARTALGFLAASAVVKESDTIRAKEICGSLIRGFWKAYALLIKGTDVARTTISTSSCLECGLDAWSCNNPLVNQRNKWESKELSLRVQRNRKSEHGQALMDDCAVKPSPAISHLWTSVMQKINK